jgi:putative peptide zinc metalloprotease protein
MRSRFLAALALSLALSLAWGPVAAVAQEEVVDGGGGGDNTVVAVNTKDGSSEFKVSFKLVRTSSDVVEESNIAVAFASCEACETVAIAFQVVLVKGTPGVVIPENYAIALNFECTSCETLASAYQFVLGTDGNVHFSPEGNRALAEIRQALRDVAGSDELTFEEIQLELDALAADLRTVLTEEMVASGPPDVDVQEVQDPATTEATPSPTPSSSPTAGDPSPAPTSDTISPSPSGTTTPVEGASPSPATSPTPTEEISVSPDSSPTPSASVSP